MEVPAETGNDNRDSALICSPVSTTDTNGNDNIDEAGSEDSGMSSVDNHNLTGRHHVAHTETLSLSVINTAPRTAPHTSHTTQLTAHSKQSVFRVRHTSRTSWPPHADLARLRHHGQHVRQRRHD